MKTQLLFPTVLGFSLNKNHNKIKNKLINYCVDQANTILKGGDNWASKIYNTCGTKEIVSVKEFKVLNDWIFKGYMKR